MASDLPSLNTAPLAPGSAGQPNRRDPWQMAWRIAASNDLLAAVLVALAVLLLLAAWLPQAPSGASPTTSDLAIYSRWLALVQSRLGLPVSTLLKTLGLFSISTTFLYRVLIGMIGCALAVRLVNYVEETWNGRFPPAPPEHTTRITSDRPTTDIIASLHRQRFRARNQGDYFVADRFPLADIAQIMTVIGALLLLVGIALTATSGWRNSDVSAGVGETVSVGNNTPYTLRLDNWQEDSTGQVTLLQENEPLASGLIAPGHAWKMAGLSVHLQNIGPAIRATALISGEPLNLLATATASAAHELLLQFTPDESEQFFALPDIGLFVRLSFSQSTQSFRVLLNRTPTGATLFEGDLPPDGIVHADNVTLKLTPEKYASLTITHDPGTWPTAAGWLVGMLGLLGTLVWPSQRIWLCAKDEGTDIIGITGITGTIGITGDSLPSNLTTIEEIAE